MIIYHCLKLRIVAFFLGLNIETIGMDKFCDYKFLFTATPIMRKIVYPV